MSYAIVRNGSKKVGGFQQHIHTLIDVAHEIAIEADAAFSSLPLAKEPEAI